MTDILVHETGDLLIEVDNLRLLMDHLSLKPSVGTRVFDRELDNGR